MAPYTNDFKDFDSKIWLNAASEGPLPNIADQALQEAIIWKSLPYELNTSRFQLIPKGLKTSIGQLINVPPLDVILANSATYGIHLLADGFPWADKDEVLLMQNDFPSDILPWLSLQQKGVVVKQCKSQGLVLTPEEVLQNISAQTKMICLPHVHTFSGHVLDIQKIGEICKDKNIIFVVNISQSVGSMPVDLKSFHVDAVVAAGYKWLLGPYGTGFVWMTPELRQQLVLNRAYWISMMSDDDLKSEDELTLSNITSARKYDIFGTANFFNFVPFKASIDYLINVGLDQVWDHNNKLIDQFINALDLEQFDLISQSPSEKRSGLVFISHKDKNQNQKIYEDLISKDIYTAFWKGNIRIAPHLYNTGEDIERVVEELNRYK